MIIHLTSKQIADDIREVCGCSLVSFGKLAKYLGMSPNTARHFLAPVPCYQIGRKRCFMVKDVAKYIESCQAPIDIAAQYDDAPFIIG